LGKYKIVVTDDRYKNYEEEKKVFESIDAELVIGNYTAPDEVSEACRDADGILCNLAPMPQDVIESLERCKIISRYGVGYDNVDVKACTKKGIYVANVPDYCAEDVSDHALALLMGCIRKIARRDAQVREGRWNVGSEDPVYRACGKTFAFLGFGTIGRCLFRKIKGLNFSRVLVYDPYLDKDSISSLGAVKVEMEEALKDADYISIHMPLNDKTRGIIDKTAFSIMKKSAILINTSRGPIVDEDALIDALKSGKINSAGLDVHKSEPLEEDNPLKIIENCILTDHMGWYSEESMAELKRKAAENIKDVISGSKPKYAVNTIILSD